MANHNQILPEFDTDLIDSSKYGVEPSEAVIYKVSPDGTERMVAYWDAKKKNYRIALIGEKK